MKKLYLGVKRWYVHQSPILNGVCFFQAILKSDSEQRHNSQSPVLCVFLRVLKVLSRAATAIFPRKYKKLFVTGSHVFIMVFHWQTQKQLLTSCDIGRFTTTVA